MAQDFAVERLADERLAFDAVFLASERVLLEVLRLRLVALVLPALDAGLLERAWRAALARPAAERWTFAAALSAEAALRWAVPATLAPALVIASSQSW
jgi:hypothetical protein